MRLVVLVLLSVVVLGGRPEQSDDEKLIQQQIRSLRDLPDSERGGITRSIALKIRALEPGIRRVSLASSLANLATEGDFGSGTLQEVATTLATSLESTPSVRVADYIGLAELIRYEKVQVSLNAPQLGAAMEQLKADDLARQDADFELPDLRGHHWQLKSLKGKVVMVNFWATWCPPCRKELPTIQKLYDRLAKKGLVVLAISDESDREVRPFVAEHNVSFPVLLDPGRQVNERFRMQGIPRTFVFNRDGKLVAQSIDMRTESQFVAMLAAAGLK